ncbi:MAG TPA: hypothetical protein G4O02_10985 [Caldilineae bacterium]|nr:hypothetical protein [Caldilineae bacterium]
MLDLSTFQSPPKIYGAAPFWSWNDDLQEEELVRQIGLMDEAGWGGFFMHSRVGLITPYLSRRWFECVKACVAEAKQRGMHAWLYDEDKWPSGFAGGIVPALAPQNRAKALYCLVDHKPTHIAERLGVWIARREGGQLVDFQPAPDPSNFDPATHAWIQIYPVTEPLTDPWFNGYCYFDALNPEAVRAFIESTYEPYAREVGEAFGTVIPGVFTDEPQYIRWPRYQRYGANMVPWTDDLPRVFRERNGYDLIPELPSLFFDTGDYMRVRYDFWRTVTLLFVESFTRQVGEWCAEHNLMLTGHMMAEDTLEDQIRWIGAAMPHYEYMQLPGIDKLCRHIDQPVTAKQLDSVVCQLGKPRALCEAYGCSGQDFSFAGRKWIGDHLYALGISLLNPHLSLYSMRGARKRDFPPNIYYQQPWWPYNRILDIYYTRLSYALTQGQRVVDVLVIHPIASAWTVYRPRGLRRTQRLSQELRALNDALLAIHRDYHFADEILLERYGSVKDGVFRVGEMRYKVVVIPPGTTLSRATVDLLHEFAEQGGPVIAVGEAPTLVDGRPAERVLPPSTIHIPNERAAIAQALDDHLPADVVIEGEGAEDVIYHHRRDGTREIFFLVNQDLYAGRETRVRLPGTGRLERWDPFTGQVEPLAGDVADGHTEITLSFPPVGSHLLVMHTDLPPASSSSQPAPATEETITLPDRWTFHRLDPNAITLDYCAISIDDGPWSEWKPVWQAHRDAMVAGTGTPFKLRFRFQVEALPSAIELVLECPERFQITVNGQHVPYRDIGYWRDISFKRVDIRPHVQVGENLIELAGVVAEDTELEDIYLIGDFGVSACRIGPERHGAEGMDFDRYAPEFAIISEKGEGSSRDLNLQGYPFFAGTLCLRQTVELSDPGQKVVLTLDGLHAIVADIWVNGQQAGVILIPPHQVDIGHLLKPGANELEIRLVTSLRNLLGPLHRAGGDQAWTGPNDFMDLSQWTNDYIFVPFGFDAAHLRILRP